MAIVGPSGSGKTTMLQILGCLDTPTGGSYDLDGEGVVELSESRLAEVRNRRIGFVFQGFHLLMRASARRNVELPLVYAGVTAAERRRRAEEALVNVGLADRIKHRPSELSGGQQQRVAVSRALASQPSIIFADEPTGNLDSTTGAEILDFMRQAVRELKQTIVMVTHDPVAASYAQQVVFLADGRIVDQLDGPTPELILDKMKDLGG